MDYEIIDIRTVDTPGKGRLSFFEGVRDIPFEIKRIYYIYEAPEGVERGGHAHKGLTQLMFCVYGKIIVTLDDGQQRVDITLDDPSKGLIVRDMTWREMTWVKDGSVLAVAASALYDADDYIRDYGQFKNCVKKLRGGGCNCSMIDLAENTQHDIIFASGMRPKRVYYTYAVPDGIVRGGHAHRGLTQVLTCPHGSIGVTVCDGSQSDTVTLDRPGLMLEMGTMVWHDMVWNSPDSILLVAATDYYDEADYIRDRDIFEEETRRQRGRTFHES